MLTLVQTLLVANTPNTILTTDSGSHRYSSVVKYATINRSYQQPGTDSMLLPDTIEELYASGDNIKSDVRMVIEMAI